MNFFTGKIILIVSPQPWGEMRVSKHHYAIEAAKSAAHVYFMDPPDESASGVQVEPLPGFENISVVKYRPFFPTILRFHARPVFDLLMRIQLGRIRRHFPKVDILWCFEFNQCSDLRLFKADTIIYHPVDVVVYDYQIKPAAQADLILSVSREILEAVSHKGVPSHLIEHGLAESFLERAPEPATSGNDRPRFGYVGNLLRPEINHPLLTCLISGHPEVDFVFWGQYDGSESLRERYPRVPEFIAFLQSAENVELRGVRTPEILAREIGLMDGFLMFYVTDALRYDKSNSHKILEYLSTGKVVVASHTTAYRDRPGLLCMPDMNDDSRIPAIFDDTLRNLAYLNSAEPAGRRIRFAEDNTYAKQLARISDLLLALKH